jgi:hypothetical protein
MCQGNGVVRESLVGQFGCLRVVLDIGPEGGKWTMIGAGGWLWLTQGQGNHTWWLTWIPEVGDEVRYGHVPWLDMSRRELEEFQYGFSARLKERLDIPGALPVSG